MRVRVLGCSAGIGAGLRTTPLLIDDDILIDCGTGAGDLRPAEMRKLSHVFLTHAHLDHIAALPFLADTAFEHLRPRPLLVHCLDETYRALRQHIFNWKIWPDFFELPDKAAPVLIYEPMSYGETSMVGSRRVEMIEVNHSVPAAAYRIEDAHSALAFSGDTALSEAMWAALNRHAALSALMVECTFPEAERELSRTAGHHCPSTLAADLVKLKHRPRTYITHLKPGAEHATMQEVRKLMPGFDLRPLLGGEIFEL